jgi:hypothetical protein
MRTGSCFANCTTHTVTERTAASSRRGCCPWLECTVRPDAEWTYDGISISPYQSGGWVIEGGTGLAGACYVLVGAGGWLLRVLGAGLAPVALLGWVVADGVGSEGGGCWWAEWWVAGAGSWCGCFVGALMGAGQVCMLLPCFFTSCPPVLSFLPTRKPRPSHTPSSCCGSTL